MTSSVSRYVAVFASVLLVVVLLAFGAAASPVSALQVTATPTNTSAPTSTPTPTATPIATPLPLLNGTTSYVFSARCGSYGATVTGSDCFQAEAGGGIGVYNVAGARVWGVNGSTGMVGGAGSTISVTNGMTLTPGSSYQPLTSAGTVTVSVMTTTGFAAGDRVTFANQSATSIIFADGSGTLRLTGDITLGQFDTLSLIYDGTEWLETSTSNN